MCLGTVAKKNMSPTGEEVAGSVALRSGERARSVAHRLDGRRASGSEVLIVTVRPVAVE